MHPLTVVVGAFIAAVARAFALTGDGVLDEAIRLLTAFAFVSIAYMCAAVGHRLAGVPGALAVGVLVLTRPYVFDFAYLSSFDIGFAALCLAGFVEESRGRTTRAVGLLTCAGLIRPEAWIFAACIVSFRPSSRSL